MWAKYFSAIFLALLVLPNFALSDSHGLPALYDVVGVASDDTLNVRRGPDGSTEVIGSLSPHQQGVEIIAFSGDRRWGRTVFEGENGWVSMRFLELRADSWAANSYPLACHGTEPFWSLMLTENSAHYDSIAEGSEDLSVRWRTGSANNAYGSIAVGMSNATSNRVGLISRQICSDGMSDADFGWSFFLINANPGNPNLLTGCCSMDFSATR